MIMKSGDVVDVSPETISWNPTTKTIEGKVKGKKIIVPKNMIALQDIGWDKTNFPKEIEEIIEHGFTGIVRRVDGERITVSRREWQERQYNKIQEGGIYRSKIIRVTSYAVFVRVKGLMTSIYVTDCSRARMNDLRNFFKVGQNIKVRVQYKQRQYPYQIFGSIKEAYSNIYKKRDEYEIGDYIYVRLCERLNDDGYWIEVTPNIPGILNGEKERLDRLNRGDRLKVQIIEISTLGIKCQEVQ